MALVGLTTATTLAELISAIHRRGRQYIWANKLAPGIYQRGLSYNTAMISWIGAIATGCFGNLSVPLNASTVLRFFILVSSIADGWVSWPFRSSIL